MAKETIIGGGPEDHYALQAWELVGNRPINPNFIKIVDGQPFAPASILRNPQPTPNEGASQSGTPTSNP